MSGCTIQGTWAMPTVSWARSWSQVGRESTYEKLTRSEHRIKLLEILVVSFNCSMSPSHKSRSFTAKPRAAFRLYYGAQRQRYNTYSLWDANSLRWEHFFFILRKNTIVQLCRNSGKNNEPLKCLLTSDQSSGIEFFTSSNKLQSFTTFSKPVSA